MFAAEQSRLARDIVTALETGDGARASRLVDDKEQGQYVPLHDRIIRFMAEIFAHVVVCSGPAGLLRFHLATAEGQRAGFEKWEQMTPAEFAQTSAYLLKQHMGRVDVSEDSEKFTIEQALCGSGGRLQISGAYAGPGALPFVEGPSALTLGPGRFPVYCSHCRNCFDNVTFAAARKKSRKFGCAVWRSPTTHANSLSILCPLGAPAAFNFHGRSEMKDAELKHILLSARTVAAVGLSANQEKESYWIVRYLQEQGYRIIPVNPNYAEVLGQKAYPDLTAIPEPVDVVQVFRPPADVPAIVEKATQIKAKVVWMQEGIAHAEAAAAGRAASS